MRPGYLGALLSTTCSILAAGCASVTESTRNDDRLVREVPVTDTTERPGIGAVWHEAPAGPALMIFTEDTCTTKVTKYFDRTVVHERTTHGMGWNVGLGVALLGSGAGMIARASSLSDKTTTDKDTGKEQLSPREEVSSYGYIFAISGVASLGFALVQGLRAADDEAKTEFSEVGPPTTTQCNRRPVSNRPVSVAQPNGAVVGASIVSDVNGVVVLPLADLKQAIVADLSNGPATLIVTDGSGNTATVAVEPSFAAKFDTDRLANRKTRAEENAHAAEAKLKSGDPRAAEELAAASLALVPDETTYKDLLGVAQCERAWADNTEAPEEAITKLEVMQQELPSDDTSARSRKCIDRNLQRARGAVQRAEQLEAQEQAQAERRAAQELAGRRASWQPRIARNLAMCDSYVSQVRRRKAEMYRLARSGSPRLEEVNERNIEWLQQQQDGAFGAALADLRQIMSEMEEADDGNGSTMRLRVQLARATQSRCQP